MGRLRDMYAKVVYGEKGAETVEIISIIAILVLGIILALPGLRDLLISKVNETISALGR